MQPTREVRSALEELQLLPETNTEGGNRAWCTVLGGWLALFATFGYSSSFGVYQDLYTRAGTSSSSNISWIGSSQLFFFIAMGLPAGKLLDKGYFRLTVLTGSIIYIFSMFMLSLAHINKYYQLFLSQGIGMGIGTGLVYLPSMAVQAHHWKERRALAMGIVITGSSLGGIIYPILLNHLFHNSVGFAWGVRVSAFITLAFLIAANCLMSPKLPTVRERDDIPGPQTREILADWPFFLAVLGSFLIIWGLFFPSFYLQLFTILHGLSPTLAFYQLTIQNSASVLGRTIPNIVADHVGPVNVLIAASLGTGFMVFGMFGLKDNGGVIAFSILYGFFSGAVLSLFVPTITSFSRGVNEMGIRMGVAYMVTSFAFLSGTPISGALLNNGTHWYKPIIFNGTAILAGVPLLLMSRSLQAKRKHTQRV